MMDLYSRCLDLSMTRYHKRGMVEVVFAAIRMMYGSHVRCVMEDSQRRELVVRTACYVELVARSKAYHVPKRIAAG